LLTTSLKGEKAARYGILATDEQKKRMSDAQKKTSKHPTRGKKRPNHSKLMSGTGNPMYGVSSPTKGTKVPTTTCPHCGRLGGIPQLNRWHFDKCKFK
jgi:hypothetical protein